MDKKEIGKKIKAIRQEKAFSQREMANLLNESEMHPVWDKRRISNLERGTGNLSLKKAIFLFQCLGIEIEMMFKYNENDK
jgi:transcriptional regulator with XRE-family HTH domain